MFLSKIGLFSILLIFYRSVIVMLTFVKKKSLENVLVFFPLCSEKNLNSVGNLCTWKFGKNLPVAV